MIILLFVFGLIIGSFLNALIYRLSVDRSITETHSICPHCKHELSALDLIPLFSFVFLKGKCRYCGKKISWQYPIVEFITGLGFVLIAHNYGLWITDYTSSSVDTNIVLIFSLIFFCFFIVVGAFDFLHYLILDKVLIWGIAVALVFDIYKSFHNHNFGIHSALVQGLFGVFIISGFFLTQYLISKGRWIGFGDVKFGILLGLVFGIGIGIIMLFLAYFIGAITGMTLIALNRKEMGSRMPFGTFLSISATIMLIAGPQILSWYLKLIGL